MEPGSSSAESSALPALITQCSLGREDSSASLSKSEQESLKAGMEGWHMFTPTMASEKYLSEATSSDSSRQILEFSSVLQNISGSLRRLSETNSTLQLEATNWKAKYENLLKQKTGLCDTNATINEEFDRKVSTKCNNRVAQNGYNEQYSKLKARFRLLWGSDGDKTRRHKHEVVSYDCGNISAVTGSSKQITLVWDTPPKSVCIFTRPNSPAVHNLCKQMVRWLQVERNISVLVEPRVRNQLLEESHAEFFSSVKTWDNDLYLHDKVDLVITLGGDGTVLWAASVFKGPVPPMVSFSMGSLGFLAAFQSEQYEECLDHVMKGPLYITLRHRLHCEIVKADQSPDEKPEVYLVLNEVSIDRAMSACLTNLDCYCDNEFVTSVQGDGLILSTTSGSTAYSLAAGGSMVHPHVPAILFTPICPHSLSFRPLILPGYVTIKVQIPRHNNGDHAWASFDGKDRIRLDSGDALVCHMAFWPVPTASREESTHHFLNSVRERLHWNLRKKQGT